MPRRSRMRKANRMKTVTGLDHPEFTASYYRAFSRFGNAAEQALRQQEKLLNRLDRSS